MKFTWTLTGHDYTLKNESSTSIITLLLTLKTFFVILCTKNTCTHFNQIKLKKDLSCHLYKMYIFVLKKKFYVGMQAFLITFF